MYLSKLNQSFDIVCSAESWSDDQSVDLNVLFQQNVLFNLVGSERHRGGSAIFSNECLIAL